MSVFRDMARDAGMEPIDEAAAYIEQLERERYEQAMDDYLEGDEPEPCPMGCGHTTDDVAGGPCSACWARLDAMSEEGRRA